MLTLWLILVSFCLFHEGVIYAPLSDQSSISYIFESVVLNKCTLLKPYLRDYETLYGPDKRNNGRRLLNVRIKHKPVGPMSASTWTMIGSFPKTSLKNNDKLDTQNSVTIAIYYEVLWLLLKKINEWLKNNEDITSILYYLGFEQQTIDVLNMSMTELFFQHRKLEIKIDLLAHIFYYSCNIQNMVGINGIQLGTSIVRQKFIDYTEKYKNILRPGSIIHDMNEDTFVENLKTHLRSIDEKTNNSFTVAIPSMKFWILLRKSNDKEIQLIQNRNVLQTINHTCQSLVLLYVNESDYNKINAYHLNILGFVATHLFGYVHNHFELMSNLRHYYLEDYDLLLIKQFSRYVSAYTSVFIDRYFEFSGYVNQNLVFALFRIMYFLDPDNPQTPDVKSLTEEERSALNERAQPSFTVVQYFEDAHLDNAFDQGLWDIINYAFQTLIKTFIGEGNWYHYLPTEYKEKEKKFLMKYLITNNNIAIRVLEIFANELNIDQSLYEKYALNGPSQTPYYAPNDD